MLEVGLVRFTLDTLSVTIESVYTQRYEERTAHSINIQAKPTAQA